MPSSQKEAVNDVP